MASRAPQSPTVKSLLAHREPYLLIDKILNHNIIGHSIITETAITTQRSPPLSGYSYPKSDRTRTVTETETEIETNAKSSNQREIRKQLSVGNGHRSLQRPFTRWDLLECLGQTGALILAQMNDYRFPSHCEQKLPVFVGMKNVEWTNDIRTHILLRPNYDSNDQKDTETETEAGKGKEMCSSTLRMYAVLSRRRKATMGTIYAHAYYVAKENGVEEGEDENGTIWENVDTEKVPDLSLDHGISICQAQLIFSFASKNK